MSTLFMEEYYANQEYIKTHGKPVSAEPFKNPMYNGFISNYNGVYFAISTADNEYYSIFGAFSTAMETVCIFPSFDVAEDTKRGIVQRIKKQYENYNDDLEIVRIIPLKNDNVDED